MIQFKLELVLERCDGVWYIAIGQHGFAYDLWFVRALIRAIRRQIRGSVQHTEVPK